MRLVFDRGTILLLDPPAHLDLSEVPDVLWDPRVRAHRAPARGYPDLKALLSHLSIQFSDSVRAPDRRPDAWSAIELRPYQEAALGAWELARRRGLVVLPTGSGKTRVAVAAMARTRLASLCLVPTRVLLDQWTHELQKSYRGVIGCYGDGVRDLAPVTVATFESAYRHMDRLGNRFDLLVVDEAHHFGCGIRDEALEMSIAGGRLGLTATPPRDPAAAARLATLIGPTVFELSIGDLAGRFLASFDVVTLHLELTPAERSAYDRDGGARALLPAAQLPCSVEGDRLVPHFLGPHDHPWLRALLEEHERYVGRPKRELTARLREPLPVASPAGKRRLAIQVLERLSRAERRAPVPPRRARAALFGEAARTPTDPPGGGRAYRGGGERPGACPLRRAARAHLHGHGERRDERRRARPLGAVRALPPDARLRPRPG